MKGLKRVLLFGLDPRTYENVALRGSANFEFSHDLTVLNLADIARSSGARVLYGSSREPHLPFFEKSDLGFEVSFFHGRVDAVIFSGPENYHLKSCFPEATGLCVIPAVNIIEESGNIGAGWTAQLAIGFANQIDYVITQNSRMKDLIFFLASSLAEWKDEDQDRIFVVPTGLNAEIWSQYEELSKSRESTRKEIGFKENDVVTVNGGGLWRWTNIIPLIDAIDQAPELQGTCLIQTGISQSTNLDHNAYIFKVKTRLESSRRETRNRIFLKESWSSVSDVRRFIAASDIGINLNKSGLENWQSQRVRVLEYIAAKKITIATPHDGYEEYPEIEKLIVRLPNHNPSYQDWVKAISDARLLRLGLSDKDFYAAKELLDPTRRLSEFLEYFLQAKIGFNKKTVLLDSYINPLLNELRFHYEALNGNALKAETGRWRILSWRTKIKFIRTIKKTVRFLKNA
jgi:hypothetical protein